MAEFVSKVELRELVTRVEVLEHEVEGEKLVTRHILEHTRRNSDELAAIKTRLDRVEEKVDGLDRKVGGLERKLEGLTRSLPVIVNSVMREVLDERDRKR